MVFIKGQSTIDRTAGYYNTSSFERISVKDLGTSFSVCGYIHLSGDYSEPIALREGFNTEKEAESWLIEKAKEWGIKLFDPNH